MNISSCLYQCYCLTSHFTTRYYLSFPKKCKSVLYFLHLLGLRMQGRPVRFTFTWLSL